MKIGFIADVHYDNNLYHNFTLAFEHICARLGLDYLVFAGDTVSGAGQALSFYHLLQSRTGTIIRQIPGNHEQYILQDGSYNLWDAALEEDSKKQYEALLYDDATSLHLHPIDTGKWVVFGDCGWYDYSFDSKRPSMRRIKKLGSKFAGGIFWTDVHHIDGNRPDPRKDIQRTLQSVNYLADHFRNVRAQPGGEKKHICAVTHMAPTKLLCHGRNVPIYRNYINFLGSETYRMLYEKYGVELAISGHTHQRKALDYHGIHYAAVPLGNFYQWRYKQNVEQELEHVMYVLEG